MATKIQTLIVLILLSFILSDLTSVLSQVEEDIKKLGEVLLNNIKNKCIPSGKCSHLSCSKSVNPNLECNVNFKISQCNTAENLNLNKTCTNYGHLLSLDSLTVVLANGEYSTPVKVTQAVEEIVNFGSILNDNFIDLYNRNSKNYKWMYFGSYNGAHMSYPGKEKCSLYDNRYRQWFTGAVTAIKNIFIVIDISGDMGNDPSILKRLQFMIKIILDSLILKDKVAIITFNNNAYSLYSTFIQAKAENKKILLDTINNLNSADLKGQSNLENAFLKINEVLDNSKKQRNIWDSCKTNILLFSYGTPTDGLKGQALLSKIDALEHLQNTQIFTYSFNPNKDNYIGEISKLNFKKGTYQNIQASANIDNDLYKYLNSFFILNRNCPDKINPVWNEVYKDQSKLGFIATCSYPIIDKSNNNKLYGVIGIDLLVDDLLKEPNTDLKKINDVIESKINICSPETTKDCGIKILASAELDNSLLELTPCSKYPLDNQKSVFCNQLDDNVLRNVEVCCGPCYNVQITIGVTIGVIIFALIVIFVLLYLCVWKAQIDKEQRRLDILATRLNNNVKSGIITTNEAIDGIAPTITTNPNSDQNPTITTNSHNNNHMLDQNPIPDDPEIVYNADVVIQGLNSNESHGYQTPPFQPNPNNSEEIKIDENLDLSKYVNDEI